MRSNLWIAGLILVILLLLDLYTWQALRTVVREPYRRLAAVFHFGTTALLLLILFSSFFFSLGRWPVLFRNYLLFTLLIFVFAKIILLPFVLIDDLVRLVQWIGHKVNPRPAASEGGVVISRKEFILQMGLTLALLHSGGLIYGMLFGGTHYKVRRMKLSFTNLPPEFDGLRIAQLSDIHSGSFVNESPLGRIVRLTNNEKPDIILFTGDLVNDVATEAEFAIPTLGKLQAPMGVYSILGNHDYGDYAGLSDEDWQQNMVRMKQTHKRLGWKLLLNEHVALQKGNAAIRLAGSENWGKGRFAKYGKLDQTLQGLKKEDFIVLMSHDPSHWEAEILDHPAEVNLTLSGHTHGMQYGVRVPGFQWSPSQYVYEQWAGIYRKGKQYIHVNPGVGYLGYPGRLGIRPEISIIELKRG